MGTHPIFESDFDCLTDCWDTLGMTLRTIRAGTRSIAREEIKRVKKSLEKVRRWEKKWVVLEESGLKVYRWVPKPREEREDNEKVSPLKQALKTSMNEKYGAKGEALPASVPQKDDKPSEPSAAAQTKPAEAATQNPAPAATPTQPTNPAS